jgi:hypothetical protein
MGGTGVARRRRGRVSKRARAARRRWARWARGPRWRRGVNHEGSRPAGRPPRFRIAEREVIGTQGRGVAGIVGRGRQFMAAGIAALHRPAHRPYGLRISGGSSAIVRIGAADHGRRALRQVGLSPTHLLRDRGLSRSNRLRVAIDCLFGGRRSEAPAHTSAATCSRRRTRRGALARSWADGEGVASSSSGWYKPTAP